MRLARVLPSFLLFAIVAIAQSNDKPEIEWQHGPVNTKVGGQANLAVPEGYLFTGPDGARTFMQLTENIPSGRELGVLASAKDKWFAIFEFSDVGYIKDDEKKSLDADAVLESIRKGTEAANEERRQRGWGAMTIVGWVQRPHYDDATHNLEWAFEGKDEKSVSVTNYSTRYLGRRGYMSVELVVSSENLQASLPDFRRALAAFSYTPDNDYRSFVKGDKVA
jgi:uncharacterized membrane-anchored protein